MISKSAREDKTPPPPLSPWENRVYGLFGYEGVQVDIAINHDSVEAMEWAVKHGIVDRQTKTLDGWTLTGLCDKKAPRCAEYLHSIWN